MKIDQEDFKSYITIKLGLADSSIRLCSIRLKVILRWFGDKEFKKENVEAFFFDLKRAGRKNTTLNTYLLVFKYLQSYFLDRGVGTNFFEGFQSFPEYKAPIEILTPDEIEGIMRRDNPLDYNSKFISIRDKAIFEHFKNRLTLGDKA